MPPIIPAAIPPAVQTPGPPPFFLAKLHYFYDDGVEKSGFFHYADEYQNPQHVEDDGMHGRDQ
jgi:hypothetical protein